MTCGEETEGECLRAIEPRDRFVFDEVRDVRPATTALNAMISQCRTDYLVPLDADMIMRPGFFERISSVLAAKRDDPSWHSLLFPLWDTLTQEKIMALKVFRTSVVKSIPYQDKPCPDIQHYKDLTDAGYVAVNLMHEAPIGDHVVRGNFFCYAKYRDLYTVARTYPDKILESHFKGGCGLKTRAKAHMEFFTRRYEETGNEDYLYCLAGMVEGLTNPLTYRSKDLGDREMRVPITEAKNRFHRWAFKDVKFGLI